MKQTEKKQYRNFFFDFDGMICDTYPHIVSIFVECMKETRGVEIDYSEAYDKFKVSFATARDFYGVNDAEWAYFLPRYADLHREPHSKLYPGIREFLEENVRRGGKNYIYTNRGETLYEYLDFFALSHLFTDSIISAKKPDPAPLLAMMARDGLAPADCVVVGDRPLDVQGGRNAGLDGILFDEDGRNQGKETTYLIGSCRELFDFLT